MANPTNPSRPQRDGSGPPAKDPDHPETRHPPSYPTRRSRRVRDAVLLLSGLAWAGTMYAIRRESMAHVTATEGMELKGVFSELFEPYLTFRFRVSVLGVTLTGRAERLTRAPYEGRLVVTHRGRAKTPSVGTARAKLSVEFDWPSRWDVKTGFVMTEIRALLSIPGVVDQEVNITVAREGEFLVSRVSVPGLHSGERAPKPVPVPFPEGADITPGFLDRAPVEELGVGTKWTERTFDLAGRAGTREVEVVERGEFEIAGRKVPAFRAVARIEQATGRFRDFERWYDCHGRCLRQEMPFSVVSIVLEREDLPPKVRDTGR